MEAPLHGSHHGATSLHRRSHGWFEIDPTRFHRQNPEASSKCWEVTRDADKQALPVSGKRPMSLSQSASINSSRSRPTSAHRTRFFSNSWVIIRDHNNKWIPSIFQATTTAMYPAVPEGAALV